MRDGQDDRVRRERWRAADLNPEAVGIAHDRGRARAQADLDAGPLQRALRGQVVDLAERHVRVADVSGGGVSQQPLLENVRRLRERRVGRA